MSQSPQNAKFYEVPIGARPAECRSCRATIYFVTTPSGGKMPVDCDVDGGHEPGNAIAGSGVSHFSTCPDADRYSKSRRRS